MRNCRRLCKVLQRAAPPKHLYSPFHFSLLLAFPLNNLPEEIQIEIISALSVDGVVRLSMTCKQLREACFFRPIWLSLLQDLDVTQAPDISPNHLPDELSTEELYTKAITAVRNSHTWRTPGALRFRQDVYLTIDPVVRLLGDGEDRGASSPALERIDPRLLPGGRHALVENHGRLELWSLFPRARMWTATPSEDADCVSYDFEVIDGGNAVMVAVLFLNIVTGCFVQVYRVEFETWEDQLIRQLGLPLMFFFRLMIRGDLVMIHMPHNVQITLWNWRTNSTLFLNFTNAQGRRTNARAALISNQHLIISMHMGALALIAIPLDSLSGYWIDRSQTGVAHSNRGLDITFTHATREDPDPIPQAETDIDAPTRPNHALRLRLADPPVNDDEEPYILALHAFVPVWQRDINEETDSLTEIYVVAYDNLTNNKKKSLLSYRAQLTRLRGSRGRSTDADRKGSVEVRRAGRTPLREATNEEWCLKLVQDTRAPSSKLPWNSQSITNSGTMFSLTNQFNCYTLFTTAPQPANVLPLSPDFIPENTNADPTVVTVDPSSGALVVGTPGLVRVLRIDQ